MKKSYNSTRVKAPPYSLNDKHWHKCLPVDHQRWRHYPRPNFIIELRSGAGLNGTDVKKLVSSLGLCPDDVYVSPRGVGSMYFGQWVDTLKGMVSLWESRLNGAHQLTPRLEANVEVPSDSVELEGRLRNLFSEHVRGLMGGELVNKWMKRVKEKDEEIASVASKLRGRRHQLHSFNELVERRNVLIHGRNLIDKRVREFKAALRCVLRCLGSQIVEEEEEDEDVFVARMDLFQSHGDGLDWGRIQAFVSRECNRLEAGLPIYVYRRDILRQIHGEQIVKCCISPFGFLERQDES